MPEPCGSFKSVRTAEKRDLASNASASAKLAAGTATCFIRASAVCSMSRSSGLSSTRRIGSIACRICNYPITNSSGRLFNYAGGHSGPSCLFLKAFQFLAGSVQRLLLGVDVRLLLPGIFGVLAGITELCSCIGVVTCGPNTRFTPQHVKLALQQRGLMLLRVNFGFPLVSLKLRGFRRRGFGLVFRVAGLGVLLWVGRLCRRVLVSRRRGIRGADSRHGVIVNDAHSVAGLPGSAVFARDVAQRGLILLRLLLCRADGSESKHESYCN